MEWESASDASRCEMSSPRISYTPRPAANPAAEQSALAVVYKILLESKGTHPGAPDAGKEINERSGKPIIPE